MFLQQELYLKKAFFYYGNYAKRENFESNKLKKITKQYKLNLLINNVAIFFNKI